MDEEHFMNTYPFRVGGRGKIALKYAKKFIDVKPEIMDEAKDKKPKLPQSIKDKEERDAEIEAKKASGVFKGMMDESIPAIEQMETMKREIRFQLDSFDKGIIDGDDLANALEEIVFGRKAPGVNTDADFEREQRRQMNMREEDAIEDEPVTEDIFGPAEFLKSKGIGKEAISAFMKMHSKDIIGASEGEIVDEFVNFATVNTEFLNDKVEDLKYGGKLKEHFSRFLKDYQ